MNTVSVWKDKLILDWDGNLPPGANSKSVHHPSDVIPFWKNLDGYARYSKRSGAFILDLSLQNAVRLKKEFEDLVFKQGKEVIQRLKSKQEKVNTLTKRAEFIKTAPIEKLPKYDYKVTPLGDWHHREVVFLVNMPIAPIFADCGTGKTFAVLAATEQQIKKGVITPGKTLVAAKLATLETGWLEDCEKFTNLKAVVLWEGSKYKKKEKILKKLEEPADIYIINHDGLRVYEDELSKKAFEKVVVDESTILKGFRGLDPRTKGGKFGKSLHRVASQAKCKAILSGTPAPNGPCDLWGQFAFLDPEGLFLEATYRDFETRFYETVDLRKADQRYQKDSSGNFLLDKQGNRIKKPLGPRAPRKMVPKLGSPEKVNEIVNPISFRVKLRDHIEDFPELTITPRLLIMPNQQLKHYNDMKEKLKVEINDERITVPIALSKIMKLRQITGGFIIDNEETAHEIKGSPKLAELDSLLNDEIDKEEKVVIYAQYRWEIEQIVKRYKNDGIVSVYGGNSSKVNLENIKVFRNDPSVRIIVLHPKSAAHGVTFTVARYMIFYSISHSSEDNYQCIKRIERAGQKNAMQVFYLLCKKSIDQDIYYTLGVKEQMQSRIIDGKPESRSQSEIDEQLVSSWG